jgi:hypothetical protein
MSNSKLLFVNDILLNPGSYNYTDLVSTYNSSKMQLFNNITPCPNLFGCNNDFITGYNNETLNEQSRTDNYHTQGGLLIRPQLIINNTQVPLLPLKYKWSIIADPSPAKIHNQTCLNSSFISPIFGRESSDSHTGVYIFCRTAVIKDDFNQVMITLERIPNSSTTVDRDSFEYGACAKKNSFFTDVRNIVSSKEVQATFGKERQYNWYFGKATCNEFKYGGIIIEAIDYFNNTIKNLIVNNVIKNREFYQQNLDLMNLINKDRIHIKAFRFSTDIVLHLKRYFLKEVIDLYSKPSLCSKLGLPETCTPEEIASLKTRCTNYNISDKICSQEVVTDKDNECISYKLPINCTQGDIDREIATEDQQLTTDYAKQSQIEYQAALDDLATKIADEDAARLKRNNEETDKNHQLVLEAKQKISDLELKTKQNIELQYQNQLILNAQKLKNNNLNNNNLNNNNLNNNNLNNNNLNTTSTTSTNNTLKYILLIAFIILLLVLSYVVITSKSQPKFQMQQTQVGGVNFNFTKLTLSFYLIIILVFLF